MFVKYSRHLHLYTKLHRSYCCVLSEATVIVLTIALVVTKGCVESRGCLNEGRDLCVSIFYAVI